MKWKIDNWSELAPIAQALTAVLLLFITAWLMCKSNSIADKSNKLVQSTSERTNEIIQAQRKSQIRPILKVTADRGIFKKSKADCIVVKITNVGTGTAKDLAVVVKERGEFSHHLFHRFFPTGTFPIPYFPGEAFYNAPIYPPADSGYGQDFLFPGKEVEFQYGSSPQGKRPDAVTLTFFLSYLDADDNEYLTVTSHMPGAGTMRVDLVGMSLLFDSLSSLPIYQMYEYKTFENLGLRIPGRFFGTQDRWMDTTEYTD